MNAKNIAARLIKKHGPAEAERRVLRKVSLWKECFRVARYGTPLSEKAAAYLIVYRVILGNIAVRQVA